MPRLIPDESIIYSLNREFSSRTGNVYKSVGSLVGWWRFNENVSSAGTVTDSSGNGRTGDFDAPDERPSFKDGVTPSRFIQDASAEFDGDTGANDSVQIGTASEWDVIIGNGTGSQEKMTFSSWIRPFSDGHNNFGRILDFGNQDVAMFVGTFNGTVRVLFSIKFGSFFGGAVQGTWYTRSSISLNDWSHVAVTFDANSPSNDPVMYINGVESLLVEYQTPTGNFQGISSETCHIGNNSAGNRTFSGQLADVAVWSSILEPEEIKALYEAEHGFARRSSGIISTPYRLELRNRDNATGSYPTVHRMGDRDRKGTFKTFFKDDNTLSFGKKIEDKFELKTRVGEVLGFSIIIDKNKWTHSGLEIRTEIGTERGGAERLGTALVFSGPPAAGGRWIQTRQKIRNPNVKIRLFLGAYNERRTILGQGLGLEAAEETDVLKIQGSLDGVSYVDIKTLQNNEETLLKEIFIKRPRSISDFRRRLFEINLHPTDFDFGGNSFYLRIVQPTVSNNDVSNWALADIDIEYYDNENIGYPFVVDKNSFAGRRLKESITPHMLPTLTATGRQKSGISDNHIKFTPGEDISPFNDGADFFNDTDVFYRVGTPPEVLPGFSSPVSNKTIFEVDLSPSEQTTFGLTERATLDDSGGSRGSTLETDPNKKQQLMVYWNNHIRRWEKIAQGVSGNAAGPMSATDSDMLGLFDMIRSGAIGFSGVGMCSSGSSFTLETQETANPDAIASYVRPTSTFGFPFEGKYEATSSQFVRAKDIGITKPFLLEKCSLNFDSKFEFASQKVDSGSRAYSLAAAFPDGSSNPSGRTLCDNQKVFIPTFFILKQSKDRISAEIPFEIEILGTRREISRTVVIPSQDTRLSTDDDVLSSVSKSRELITYGQMTLYSSGVANRAGSFGDTGAQVNIDEIINSGLRRDKTINILSLTNQEDFDAVQAQLNAVTGNFKLDFPCRLSPKIKNTAQTILVVSKSASNTSGVGALLLGNTLGGRGDGSLESSARAPVNGFGSFTPGRSFTHFAQKSTKTGSILEPPAITTVDTQSPYIIMPEDEIVFGWQYPMTTRILNAAPGKSDTFLNTMSLFGNSKLRLIGSIVKNRKEFHEGLNQNLSSDAIHELIGSEPVIDKFMISKANENRGNFFDTGVRATSKVPADRIGSVTFSQNDVDPGTNSGAAVGSLKINAVSLGPTTPGIVSGTTFTFDIPDAAGSPVSKTFTAAGSSGGLNFLLVGNAGTYSEALATLNNLRIRLISEYTHLTNDLVSVVGNSGGGFIGFTVTLTITQPFGGTVGNTSIVEANNTRHVNISSFAGGFDGVVPRGKTFSRFIQTEDRDRVYVDSTISTGRFIDSSTVGVFQSDSPITPRYYFDVNHYGHLFNFVSQGKDSRFAISSQSRLSPPTALRSPVQTTFVSSSVEDTTGVRKYTILPIPTFSSNKTRNSTIDAFFTDPSPTHPEH